MRQSSVTNVALKAVGYGKGQFLAVGDFGTILTSPDGGTWTSRASGTTQALNGVVAGPESFVAVGDGGTTLSSSDGIDWMVNIVPGPVPQLRAVSYGDGLFVAAGQAIYSSPDGKTWSRVPVGIPAPVLSVSFGNGVFVAVGTDAMLYTSSDGTNWTPGFFPQLGAAKAATFGAGRFVAVGGLTDYHYTFQMFTWVSTNAVVWTSPQTIGSGSYLSKVVYGGGRYFALGAGVLGGVFSISVDGFNWDNGTLPAGCNDVAFGADSYVLVGDNGTILQSAVITPPTITEPPRLQIIPGSPLGISIQGTAGAQLRLDYVDDLAVGADNWQKLFQLSLSGGSDVVYDTNAGTACRFYRAVVIP